MDITAWAGRLKILRVCQCCFHRQGKKETETEIKGGRRVKWQQGRNGVEERKAIKGKRTFEFSTEVNKKLKSFWCDVYSGKWGSALYSQLFLPSSYYPEDGSCLFLQEGGARVRSLKLRIQEGKWNYANMECNILRWFKDGYISNSWGKTGMWTMPKNVE